MLAVYKREFKAFFTNMIGFIFIAFLLLITGIYSTAAAKPKYCSS